MHQPTRPLFCCLSLLFLASLLGGCASYQLEGVVVEGSPPGVFFVDGNDPRLKETAIADARIQAILDPDKIRAKPLPLAVSDDYGRFAIPVGEPGAGLLEYTVSIDCEASGYGQPPVGVMPLPAPGKQVLIVLSAGRRVGPRRTPGQPKEDLIGESEKFKKQFE